MAYGTISADVIQSSVTGVSLGAGNATVFKNRIINGDMRIDQRNAGASVTPTNDSYTLDRWQAYASAASKFTIQQNAGSVTPPVGFINYLGVTSSSAYSVTSSDNFGVVQNIEGLNCADLGWGTANAKTITISFWVCSSLTGTFGGALRNSAGNRSYPFTYTINAANTWEYKTITIAGDTTGTWLTTNGKGINVIFGLGAGTTYSGTAGTWAAADYRSATGATSVVGTNGATFYITGVQFEVGSSATGFEYVNYGTQLAMCQRYFSKLNNDGSGGDVALGFGMQSATTTAVMYIKYPITMRTEPTATASNIATGDFVNFTVDSTLNSIQPGYDSASVTVAFASTGAQLRPVALLIRNNTSGYLALSAEL